jgi:hypothetical protein
MPRVYYETMRSSKPPTCFSPFSTAEVQCCHYGHVEFQYQCHNECYEPFYGFFITEVACIFTGSTMFDITKMLFHLGFKRTFGKLLGALLGQTLPTEQVFRVFVVSKQLVDNWHSYVIANTLIECHSQRLFLNSASQPLYCNSQRDQKLKLANH